MTSGNGMSVMPSWQQEVCTGSLRPPAPLSRWLLDRSSLTRRLESACEDRLHVVVLGQAWSRPFRDEALALRLRPGAWCLVREVILRCGGNDWVFARTAIPPRTLHGRRRRLAHLGDRPLGALLFAEPSMTREAMEITRLSSRHGLHARIGTHLPLREESVWGRRSLFRLAGHSLLVSEFFLPGLSVWRHFPPARKR